MTADRWRQIDAIFHAVLEKEPSQRTAFLAHACEDDEDLRANVENLLAQSGSILDQPVAELLALTDDATEALVTGSTLGHYRIEGILGAGGMGRVFRASDTRLGRSVAIKILSCRFSSRFESEARAIAALNQPNICTLYDVGPNYLVMELVEGLTLAERVRRGPVPLDEALKIAWQIAAALESAHDHGIVHRDLKPENIKITPNGTAKVLDFGLAKASGRAGDSSLDSTQALTVTQPGMLVGTPSYMAPEQARGNAVDRRADIWAFGVVLYEMLAGHRLFKGATATDTLAAVLTHEPDWSTVPRSTHRLLRLCLEKDPMRRLRDIGDARFLLDENPILTDTAVISGASRHWKLAALVCAAAALVLLALLFRPTARTSAPSLRFSVDLGDDAALMPGHSGTLALSPDGTLLVYTVGQKPVNTKLAMRRLDQTTSTVLPGTEGADFPFFSPDGKHIAFFAGDSLKKMETAGGTPVTLCPAPSPREGSWGEDGNIIFAGAGEVGLSMVSDSGGTPKSITTLDGKRAESTHRYPQVLPGTTAVLFTNTLDATGEGSIEVQPLPSGQRKTLVAKGAYGRYLPGGYLAYIHAGAFLVAPMSVERLELTGPALPVLEDFYYNASAGTASLAFSQSGLFAYVAAAPDERMRPVGIMDETGHVENLPLPNGKYTHPRVSPDGSRLAINLSSGQFTDIWVYEWGTRRFNRLPFQPGHGKNGVWSRDSKYLVFYSDAQAPGPGLYALRADGSGSPIRLVEGTGLVPNSFAPESSQLLYDVQGGKDPGLYLLPLDWRHGTGPIPGHPQLLAASPVEGPAAFSPDGRWLAYVNSSLGRPEVFVRPYPGAGGPWQVSSGGTNTFWAYTSHRFFYRGLADYRVMAADYTVTGDSFTLMPSRPWAEKHVDSFDVMPDGNHVIMILRADQKEPSHATFILNFFDDLRHRLSGAKPSR